jgi:D-alanyl-D-alanine carboxypeptidase/D-alanyl-D-alanine-endopeptidase (penicillin-binding protein 4)
VAAAGLPAQQLTTLDGSGLDRADRATCTLIEAALQQAGTTGVLASGLPVAARTGTLEHRFAGTVAAGRVRAKTGTLDDVAALSGSVVPAAAPTPELAAPVYFSIIINGMDSAIGAPLADRIALVIAGYPDAVPLGELEPRS